jgi:hypothetical protein
MCPIQFQSLLALLDTPDGTLQSKLKSSGDETSPGFRPFSMVKMSNRFLPVRTVLFHLNTFFIDPLVSWVFQTQLECCIILPS